MNTIFEEADAQQEQVAEEQNLLKTKISIPQAYQIRKTIHKNWQITEEIVDTYVVDKKKGIPLIEENKAKNKARKLTEITQTSHYVIEIVHNIIASY